MRPRPNRKSIVPVWSLGLVAILALFAAPGAAFAQETASPSPVSTSPASPISSSSPISSASPSPTAVVPSHGSIKGGAPAWSQFQGGVAHQGRLLEGVPPQPPYARAWFFARPKSDDELSNPVIDGGSVFVAGTKTVYAVAADTGQQQWSVPRQDSDALTAPAVAVTSDHRLILFTQGRGDKSQLVAIDEESHKPVWTLALEDDSRSGVTVSGTTAYVGDVSGKLYVVDAASGKLLWSVSVASGSIDSGPAIDNDTVFVTTSNRSTLALKIAALSLTTHKQVWSYTSPVPSSALTVDEGHVLFGVNVGNQAGRAVSLDASSGHLEWTQLLRSPVFAVNSGASANGTFFVVDLSGGMFAFNLANGAQQWDFQFNPARRTQFGYEDFIGPPVVAGGFVVVGLADGRLAAVDSTTGHLAWTTNTGDGALQAIAMSSEGSVVVTKSGSNGGVIGFKEGSGSLTDVLSPTTMQLGTVLTNYALAFLVLVALGLLAGYLLRKRGASKRTTGRDDQRDDLVVIEDAPQAIPESDDPTHGDPGETEGED